MDGMPMMNLGIDRVTVHLVPDGEIVEDHLGMDDGEVAQRHAARLVRKPTACEPQTMVPIGHDFYLPQKRNYRQSNQILWQLPQEKQDEQ